MSDNAYDIIVIAFYYYYLLFKEQRFWSRCSFVWARSLLSQALGY